MKAIMEDKSFDSKLDICFFIIKYLQCGLVSRNHGNIVYTSVRDFPASTWNAATASEVFPPILWSTLLISPDINLEILLTCINTFLIVHWRILKLRYTGDFCLCSGFVAQLPKAK